MILFLVVVLLEEEMKAILCCFTFNMVEYVYLKNKKQLVTNSTFPDVIF